MKKIFTIMLLLCAVILTQITQAKEGPSLGIDLGARAFTGSELSGTIDPGPSVGINGAWGITDFFSIRGQWLGSMHIGEGGDNTSSSVGFTGGNIGFGFTFMSKSKFQPLIETGVGVYILSAGTHMSDRWNITDDLLVSWGANLNLGFDYFIKDDVSIGFRAGDIYIPFPAEKYVAYIPNTTIPPTQSKIIDGSNLFLGINVTYHFGRLMEHMHHIMHGGCMMEKGEEKEEKNEEGEHNH